MSYKEKANGSKPGRRKRVRNYNRKNKIAEPELSYGNHLHKGDEMMKKIENCYRDLYTILEKLKITDLKITFQWKITQ